MKNRFVILCFVFGFTAATFLFAWQSHATLGEPADSVASDRKALSASQRSAESRKGYTVQEIKSGANSVREYIAPSGIVFAVAWDGVSHPDLTQLLGSYTSEYKKALREAPSQRGQRHFRVKGDKVVVEKWGHMRNLQGRAYVPALIPSGVSIDEIR